VGDGDWFSWPVDAYFAADIPRPSNPILGQFGFYNGGVTIPLWLLVLFTVSLNMAIYAWRLRPRTVADKPSSEPAYSLETIETMPQLPSGSLFLLDHPLVAGDSTALSAHSTLIMPVVF
jgi:hypothetical protein